MSEIKRIDLGQYFPKHTALLSQSEGEEFAEEIHLSQLAKQHEKIIFVISSKILVINYAFFRGIFGDIKKMHIKNNDYEGFSKKYEFEGNLYIKEKIEGYYKKLSINIPMRRVIIH